MRPTRAWLAILLVTIAFVPTLGFGFSSWDDPRFVTENLHVRAFTRANAEAWVCGPIAGKWRPLVFASFTFDQTLGGGKPFIFRVHSLLWHLLATGLVIALARRAGIAPGSALIAGLVFGLHPLCVEPVVWITARNYVMGVALTLAALYLAPSPILAARWGSWLATILALAAHELAVVIPLLIALDAWRRRQSPMVALPHLVLAIIFGAIHLAMVRDTGILIESPDRRLSQAYLGAIVIVTAPWRLSPFMSNDWLAAFPSAAIAGAVSTLLIFGAFKARDRDGDRVLPFGFGFALIAFLPTAGFFTTATLMADRWLYLPLVGLALVFGRIHERGGKRVRVFLMIVITMLAAGTLAQSRIWSNSTSLWQAASERGGGFVAYQNLGGALLAEELPQLRRAEEAYRKAESLAANDHERALALTGQARVALEITNRRNQVAELADAALELEPQLLPALVVRAQSGADRYSAARIAVAVDPDDPSLRQLALRSAATAGADAEEFESLQDSVRRAYERALATLMETDPRGRATTAIRTLLAGER